MTRRKHTKKPAGSTSQQQNAPARTGLARTQTPIEYSGYAEVIEDFPIRHDTRQLDHSNVGAQSGVQREAEVRQMLGSNAPRQSSATTRPEQLYVYGSMLTVEDPPPASGSASTTSANPKPAAHSSAKGISSTSSFPWPPAPRHIHHSTLHIGIPPENLRSKRLTHLHQSPDHPSLTLKFSDDAMYSLYMESYLRTKDTCPTGSQARLRFDNHFYSLLELAEELDEGNESYLDILIEDCSFAVKTTEDRIYRGLKRTTEHHVLGLKFRGQWGYVWASLLKNCMPADQSNYWPVYLVRLNWRGEVVDGEEETVVF